MTAISASALGDDASWWLFIVGVTYGRTAVAWGPTGLVGRWAGVDESPLIGETAVIGRLLWSVEEVPRVVRGGGGGGGGMVTDNNDGHKNATR